MLLRGNCSSPLYCLSFFISSRFLLRSVSCVCRKLSKTPGCKPNPLIHKRSSMSQPTNANEAVILGISKSYESQCPILCIYFKDDVPGFPAMAFRIHDLTTVMNNGKEKGLYLSFQPSRLPARFRIYFKNIEHVVYLQNQINIYLTSEDSLSIESMSDHGR